MDVLWTWGLELILILQRFDGLTLPMQLMTFTGSTEFFLLILPALYWFVDRRLGVRLAVALLLTIWLGSVLKIALHSPRPYWVDPRVALLGGTEATFGLPSLHAMNAVVMWSLLAHALHRRWLWILVFLLSFVAGLSRIYLGVHYPSDVVVGWGLGLLLLGAWWRWRDSLTTWFTHFTPLYQRLIGATVVFLVILSGVAAQLFSALTLDTLMVWPESRMLGPEAYLSAFALTDIMTVAGFTYGLLAGVQWINRVGGFTVRTNFWRAAGRYLLGVIGVLLFWKGLDLLFAPLAAEQSTLGYALRALRYGMVGFWIFGLAPYCFRLLRLATAADEADVKPS